MKPLPHNPLVGQRGGHPKQQFNKKSIFLADELGRDYFSGVAALRTAWGAGEGRLLFFWQVPFEQPGCYGVCYL
jgi:hypothetical protein